MGEKSYRESQINSEVEMSGDLIKNVMHDIREVEAYLLINYKVDVADAESCSYSSVPNGGEISPIVNLNQQIMGIRYRLFTIINVLGKNRR